MSNAALVPYDEAMLEKLAALTGADDAIASPMIDQLKINYDEESIHPRGVWVIGQRKNKEGVITEQGEVVQRAIIVSARCRYYCYHEKTKTAISTSVFRSGDQPTDKAECAARAATLGAELKFQYALFGYAFMPDGKLKEFVSYLGGSSFMPVKEHLMALTTIITPSKKINVPVYSFVTQFGEAEKKKNGTITYWIPSFIKGPALTLEQIEFFAKKRDEIDGYVDHINSMNSASAKKDENQPPVAPPTNGVSMGEYVPPVNQQSTADYINTLQSAGPPIGDDVPFDLGAATTTAAPVQQAPSIQSDEFDIEAAMAKIINGGN